MGWLCLKLILLDINLKKELEDLKFQLDQAENRYDLERAAILRHGEIPRVEKEIEELNKVEKNKLLSDTVTEADIDTFANVWLYGTEKPQSFTLTGAALN